MSKQIKANPMPVELTPYELDSVTGGNPVAVGIAALVALAAIKFLSTTNGTPANPSYGKALNDERFALAAR
jgi:hypothetical protein